LQSGNTLPIWNGPVFGAKRDNNFGKRLVKILIVDDDRLSRLLLCRALEKAGY